MEKIIILGSYYEWWKRHLESKASRIDEVSVQGGEDS